MHLARPGEVVFVAGGTGEPAAILAAWREARCFDGVTLLGLQIPGLNRLSPRDFGEDCRFRTTFLTPALRSAFADGRVELLPLHHTGLYEWLSGAARIDVAVFQAAPPDSTGRCDLGPCADLLPAVLGRNGVRLVAQINPRLPRCRDGVAVSFNRLDGFCQAETDLPVWKAGGSHVGAAVAAHVAALVEDRATLQVGIGRLPNRLLTLLGGRRGLKLHGGIVSAEGLELLRAGAVETIVAGVAIGDPAFYTQVAAAESVAFRPVPITHGAKSLSGIPRLIALNAALEVDLFGQANCEAAAGRFVSGVGGLNDFLRAARRSPGGRAVLMLPACSADGATSRIVARIGDPGLVSVQRGDVDTVVTECGVADLRGLDLDARAAALISVAAPQFRAGLAADWARCRASFA